MKITKINQVIFKELLKGNVQLAFKADDFYITPDKFIAFKLDISEVFFNYLKSSLVQYLVDLFETRYCDFEILTRECDVKYDKTTMIKLCSKREVLYIDAKYTKFFDNPIFKIDVSKTFSPIYVYESDRLVAIIIPITLT